ncbi:Flp family type IVb pilin [Pelagerythrobacter marinus]|jgi:pilus assembly protein Flp/PilA|uniref:Flp family type IVb pilin n=1 Tax=Pelagerythrobacter marinus TaxID=538382 RepID=A0ABW9UTJ3_9SPHN|nr:Flp family type IVb pilin [Pelagerythrobacter marinus]MEC9066301.1 Flp family type IVb pilin [Pseudomonadota bacterium]MXO68161.1 Flp family type IVb pilin [Pelagerythrobacter marinus]USA40678.1 Flp family type IVb pilin [Pelagerythrobacter marinus]WPZ08152.1 Flp family type IVb pilin [Pelagerythrobacter marinus]
MQSKHFLTRIGRDTRGATAVEYGLIVTLIVVACIGAFTTVADESIALWSTVSTEVTKERG